MCIHVRQYHKTSGITLEVHTFVHWVQGRIEIFVNSENHQGRS